MPSSGHDGAAALPQAGAHPETRFATAKAAATLIHVPVAESRATMHSNPLAAPRPEATRSVIAIASHPLHATIVHFPIAFVIGGLGADLAFWWTRDPFWARGALWLIGAGFFMGSAASIFGMLEFMFVKEIRRFVASWGHFLAGVTLVAIAAANWWGRIADPAAGVLPWGLFLSVVSAAAVGWAGVLGGKLVYEHNVATEQQDG